MISVWKVPFFENSITPFFSWEPRTGFPPNVQTLATMFLRRKKIHEGGVQGAFWKFSSKIGFLCREEHLFPQYSKFGVEEGHLLWLHYWFFDTLKNFRLYPTADVAIFHARNLQFFFGFDCSEFIFSNPLNLQRLNIFFTMETSENENILNEKWDIIFWSTSR